MWKKAVRRLAVAGLVLAMLGSSAATLAQAPDTDLLMRVPEPYRAACAAVEPDIATGQTAGLVCNPAGAADRAEYHRYDSIASLQAAFQAFVDRNAVDATGSSCTVGPSVTTYTIGDEHAGSLACYPNPGALGGLMLQWTDELLGILAFGVLTSGGYQEGYDWWLGAGPERGGTGPIEGPTVPQPSVAPTAPAAGPMDPAAYAQLLALVPETLRDSCRPNPYWDATQDPGELAAAHCDPDGLDGPDYATYSLYATSDAMDAAYDEYATEYRDVGSLAGPGCGQGPGEGVWESGRRFCYTYAGLSVSSYWTHEALRVLASASRPDLDWAALEAFWQRAGPVGP